MKKPVFAAVLIAVASPLIVHGQTAAPVHWTKPYNVTWTTQSKNSSESMPCGGHDIGLNVWVEKGEILFYMDRSGSFDENNQMDKLGRVRLTLHPNPFSEKAQFEQTLNLQTGAVEISGTDAGNTVNVTIWVETDRPVVHADVISQQPVSLSASYENWRTAPRPLSTDERHSPFSFAGTSPSNIPLITHPDTFEPAPGQMLWFHRNDNSDLCIDKEITQQHLDSVRDQIWNPQKNFTFGGLMRTQSKSAPVISDLTYQDTTARSWQFNSIDPAKEHSVTLYLHASQAPSIDEWKKDLLSLANASSPTRSEAWQKNLQFWSDFWNRSQIILNPEAASANDPLWQAGRNYQLFRYQLGCNSQGSYPTKFNGSLFTFDPSLVKGNKKFTPDFRAWGGGSFTSQNQRLVYWPMLKSGDFEMMLPQFDFFMRSLPAAELRTKIYWGHGGASFTEQMENYGLPVGGIYEKNWGNRPVMPRPGEDHGMMLNAWTEDQYDTVFEFCLMIADYQQFTNRDISRYVALMDSVVEFFDQHYRYENKNRTGQELDGNGHLVIFPGSALETYKKATNPVTTTTGLRTLLTRMLALPATYGTADQRARWQQILERVPPLEFREMEGRKTISPATNWTRINNTEIPQLYPVFPYGVYGIGKPDLQIAIDTYDFGVDWGAKSKGVNGWRQDPIWMARMGLTDRAAKMVSQKLANAKMRFPTFWGPNFDWIPDFNHGGSAMIALQEMLLQTDGKSIILLPTWPKSWNVRFRLHAPFATTIDGEVKDGKLVGYEVTPTERTKDVIVPAEWK